VLPSDANLAALRFGNGCGDFVSEGERPLPHRFWWNRRSAASTPRRRLAQAPLFVGIPMIASGRSSSRRYAGPVPTVVWIASACDSGIECRYRITHVDGPRSNAATRRNPP